MPINLIYSTRLRTVADWIEELDDVVEVFPEVTDDDVVFHMNGALGWRDQVEAIVRTGSGWESKEVSNFVTLEGQVPEIGEVSLFVPMYEDSVPNDFPKVDYAALVDSAS